MLTYIPSLVGQYMKDFLIFFLKKILLKNLNEKE